MQRGNGVTSSGVVADSPGTDGITVKNTFIDCASPWALDKIEIARRPASDPTSSSSSSFSNSSSRDSSLSRSGRDSGPSIDQITNMRERMKPMNDGAPARPGDAGHDEGECRPCKYAVKKVGCKTGESCEYCHQWHNPSHPKAQWRPCKGKRHRLNKLLSQLKVQAEEKGEDFDFSKVTLPPSVEANSLLKDRLRQKVLEQSNAGLKLPDKPGELAGSPRFPDSPDAPIVITDSLEELSYGKVYRL